MGKWCQNCGKVMKHPEITHCSDECVLEYVKKSKSIKEDVSGVESWDEESEPWK